MYKLASLFLGLFILTFLSFQSPKFTIASSLNWQLVYPSVGEPTAIKISPIDSNIVYASIRLPGDFDLLKSTNGGINWVSIKSGLPAGLDANWISLSPISTEAIAISLWGSGVHLSEDSGLSWTKIYNNATPRSVEISPVDINTIFVGIGGNHDSNSGVYKTIDKGAHWAKTTLANNNAQITIDPLSGNRLFADADPNFFRSTDGGDSWIQLSINHTFSNSVIDNLYPNTIYTSSYDSGYGIYRSTDNGASWILKSNGIFSPAFRLAQDTDGALYASRYFAGGGLWKSQDRAEMWENISSSTWTTLSTWGLDARAGKVIVGVGGLGIYYADTNSDQTNPVVFIPGFLGSWSYKGLIENQSTTYTDWQLTPYFTESFYQPLFSTLKNANLTDSGPNQNLFTFAYDYRKSVADTAVWLNNYLTNEVQPKNPGKKANVVAHSMGSLVARYCFEKIPGCADKINKIVTAGGPHQGTIKAYQLWEGGQFAEDNILMRVVEDLVLHAAGFPYLLDKDIIQNRFPGVRDLLPVFDYIAGKPYAALSATAKNSILESLSPTSSNLLTNLLTLSGNNLPTLSGLSVINPSAAEQTLGLWPDGKPQTTSTAGGDGTILKSSSEISGANNKNYDTEHKAYFQSAAALNDILTAFNLSASSVVTSASPPPTSVLIFLLHSPATINVFNSLGNTVGVRPDDKTVFIANPTNQNYQATVTGTGTGNFQLDALLVDSLGTTRQTVNGSTVPGQTQNFIFNAAGTTNSFSDNDGSLALTTFRQNNQISNHRSSRLWEAVINRAVEDIRANRRRASGFTTLEKTHLDLATALAKGVSPSPRQNLLKTVNALTNLLIRLDSLYRPATTTAKANQEMARSQNAINIKLARLSLTLREANNLSLAQTFQSEATRSLSLGQNYQAILSARTANMLVN